MCSKRGDVAFLRQFLAILNSNRLLGQLKHARWTEDMEFFLWRQERIKEKFNQK